MSAAVKHLAPLAGDDGVGDGTPFLGEFQVVVGVFARRLREPGRAICAYAGLLLTTAIILSSALLAAGEGLNGPLWALALLALFALVAEQQPVRLTASSEVTVAMLPVVFAAVAFGPLAAMLIGAMGVIGDARRPFARWVIWTSERSIAGGLAGVTAALVGRDGAFGDMATAVVLGFLVYAIVDAILAAAILGIRQAGCSIAFLRSAFPIMMVTVPLYTPVIVILVYAYRDISVWTILLFFAPAFAAQSLYRLYREQLRVTDELKTANEMLERANLSFAVALVAALDARDQYTAGHSASVAVYAREIARELRLPPEEQELAHLCGLVHDIGKVGLPPGILEKTGPLTAEERERVEEHSTIGERILSNVEGYTEIAHIVRHHHERYDGSGYPDRLAAEDVPLISRIISVADAYDAMTSARPYRNAMPSAIAELRLEESSGTQFDPRVAEAFQRILAARDEASLPAKRSLRTALPAPGKPLLARTG